MYSGDNKCRKKILFICSFFLSALLSFVCALRPLAANAANLTVNYFNAQFTVGDSANSWHNNIAMNQKFAPSYLYNYEWKVNSVAFSGNYANVHFETNIVLVGNVGSQSASVVNGRFHNTDFLTVKYCGSGGSNFTIRSSNVSNAKTNWYGNTPSAQGSSNNLTLTVYGDVVLSGVPSGQTAELYCGIGLSNGWAFAAVSNSDFSPTLTAYFEQQPTTISFTTDNTEALQWEQINATKSIADALNNSYQQEQDDLNNKGDELEDQADGLSLSANVTSNPFTQFFINNPFVVNRCIDIRSSLASMFNMDAFRVCSPFPQLFLNILNGVNTLFICALLIRLYYKKLKGGVDG